MNAITPNTQTVEVIREVVLGAGQAEYEPLPASVIPMRVLLPSATGALVEQTVPALLTRWTFTDEERQQIANGRDVFMTTLTGGQPFHPVLFSVGEPETV